jgi:hypothetical protein
VKKKNIQSLLFLLAALVCHANMISCSSYRSDGGVLLRIDGDPARDKGLGVQVEQFGDVDADGRPDIIAASPYGMPGNFSVYSGNTGEMLYRIESVRDEYFLQRFKAVKDITGDGIPEIAAHDNWSNRGLFVFSGSDGTLLFKTKEKIGFGDHRTPRVVVIPDRNNDGTDDIAAYWRPKGLMLISGTDGKTIGEVELPNEQGAYYSYHEAADVDRDGYADLIGFADETTKVGPQEFKSVMRTWFISTSDFQTIGKPFELPLTQMPDAFICTDINNDGVLDLVCTCITGGQPVGTVLVAVNGADGSEFWRVSGADIEGGAKMTRIDAKTGEERMKYTDARFGDTLALLPDMNSDGVPDIATGHPDLYDKSLNLYGKIHIFSGNNGALLKTLLPPDQNWRIGHSATPYVDCNFDGVPDILVGTYEFRNKERQKVGSIFVMAT